MVERIAKRIINRIKDEVSAFIDESDEGTETRSVQNKPDEAVLEIRDHLGKLIAEHHQISKQLKASSVELEALRDKVEFAIGADRDDLARAALIRCYGLKRQIAGLKARQQDIESESLEVEDLIEELSSGSNSDNVGNSNELNKAVKEQLDELEALLISSSGAADDSLN